jgi:chemotaxis receptor (MCP) glutamine deamidase CheD
MKKNGAKQKNLSAKIFGGGNVMEIERKVHTIPEDNVRLAKILLEIEDIPIVETDTKGPYTRKLLMDVISGKVYLKKTRNREVLLKVNDKNGKYRQGVLIADG